MHLPGGKIQTHPKTQTSGKQDPPPHTATLGATVKGQIVTFPVTLALHHRVQLPTGGAVSSLPREKAACIYTDKLIETLGLQTPGGAFRPGSGETTAAEPAFPDR